MVHAGAQSSCVLLFRRAIFLVVHRLSCLIDPFRKAMIVWRLVSCYWMYPFLHSSAHLKKWMALLA